MKICVVGHDASGLWGEALGGGEQQVALIAKAMAERGHEVVFVPLGNAVPQERIGKVVVKAGYLNNVGQRGLRYFTYRMPELRRVLRDEKADVYYMRGAGMYWPTVIQAARETGGISWLGLASDRDLDPRKAKVLFPFLPSYLLGVLAPIMYKMFFIGPIRSVDYVIAQNEYQAEWCQKKGIRTVLIPNMVEQPPFHLLSHKPKYDVVWCGSVTRGIVRDKGVDQLVQLSIKLSNKKFGAVGELSSDVIQEYVGKLRSMPNVELLGGVSHSAVLEIIANSRVVINTAPYEGFSNVMLEAWSLGKPVVSLKVNPNRLLDEGGLGYCANGSLDKMKDYVGKLLSNNEDYDEISARSRKYVLMNHSPGEICQRLEALSGSIQRVDLRRNPLSYENTVSWEPHSAI